MSGSLIPVLAKATGVVITGVVTTALVSSAIKLNYQNHKIKNGKECGVCKGKGFYKCKLCKGKSTIEWSPLYDPIVINPCLCPTCDGNKVQKCLNCLGDCYV
ncbi:Plastid transcriptionally active 5 [Heracleum sosnowskyi]|uniref:Plastid transcriptionally active 5 n=1 Tax=Heracleum sosnowskyi TaxID=360622 RepID=A0AAD8IYM6_9APIA|nr:Plastid transcriptionally active 5 [Heracleum sosnowskyi]